MKKLLFWAAMLAWMGCVSLYAQDTLRYHIDLRDKAATNFSLKHPEKFLSAKALQRRERQRLKVD